MCIRVGSRLNYFTEYTRKDNGSEHTTFSGVPECMSHTVLALGEGRRVHEKVIESICKGDALPR